MGLKRRKEKKEAERISSGIRGKIEGLEEVGVGGYFVAVRDADSVLKYLRPERWVRPSYDKPGYLNKLKRFLEIERELSERRGFSSRLKKIEAEFEKKFGQKAGDYELTISEQTGLAAIPRARWTSNQKKFFNQRLKEVVEGELEFITKLNHALYKKVKSAKVPVVERKGQTVSPDIGIIEKYKYGGPDFYTFWGNNWEDTKKKKEQFKKHIHDILNSSFLAFKKHNVVLDISTGNWTIDPHTKRVKYIDFEPHSIWVADKDGKRFFLSSLSAFYVNLATITGNKRFHRELKDIFLDLAEKRVGKRFKRELEKRLDRMDKELNQFLWKGA